MQVLESLVFGTLRSGADFIKEHAAVLGAIPACGAFERLAIVIRELERHGEARTTHSVYARVLVQTKGAARRTLVNDHLAPIVAAARAVMDVTPELAVVRSLPNTTMSSASLVNRALEVAKAVAPFAPELTAAGLPADFLTALDAARETLATSMDDRSRSLKKSLGAATGIRQQLWAGRRQIRVLDRLVRTALRAQEDGGLLQEWKDARPTRGRVAHEWFSTWTQQRPPSLH